MDKLELIKKIYNYHPGYNAGTKRGWSYYVGGMRDTGDWYTEKLLDASVEELQACLDELIEETKPGPPLTPEELEKQKKWVQIPHGDSFIHMNLLEYERLIELHKKAEMEILWGKRA